ncbi:hypothetical protein [Cellulophaga fucicola]|uniref:Lipoprotein n=1 Tax=Cellulophaga fucicola TaxID=76595 RepID=A0A1K1MLP0_9FLAO|nr:hypothetical protein [Cellulophaga fucicola]SFW24017.1 hypothetical protein SAMN05660313_00706 [Cellulophaga fucicola]
MNLYKITTYLCFLLLICSCAPFKKVKTPDNTIQLTKDNLHLIDGTYQNNIENPAYSLELFWGSFYTRKEQESVYNLVYKEKEPFLITLKSVSKKRLNVTITVKDSILKSFDIKGRVKNGYFEQRRITYAIPTIFVNKYYSSKFRIGLLNRNTIITDFKKTDIGTVYFFYPFNNSSNNYNIEHKKVTSKE